MKPGEPPELGGPLSLQPFCYLTTNGRLSGRPRTIEIWFALSTTTAYLLSDGAHSHWVLNLQRDPAVSMRIGGVTFPGQARVLQGGPEEELARRLLFEKYQPGFAGDLSGWARSALPVAVDLGPAQGPR
jgi:deazaflavin-dependent oxidoreductase (nitroreductase family)